jgi:putative oxidoreductase
MPIARAFMASLFLVAGVRKIYAWGPTVAYFNKLGIVMPDLIVPLVVALEVVGGILLIVGWRVPLVAASMAIFTVGTGMAAHAFWNVAGVDFSSQLNSFLKNMAIAGGLIHIAVATSLQKR